MSPQPTPRPPRPRGLRRTAVSLLAGLLLLAGSVLLAPPASADSGISRPGVAVSFRSNGDVFWIADTACDNHSVYLIYGRIGVPGTKRQNLSSGCNTSLTLDLDFPEGDDITYWGCIDVPFGGDPCTSRVVDTA